MKGYKECGDNAPHILSLNINHRWMHYAAVFKPGKEPFYKSDGLLVHSKHNGEDKPLYL
jgi:hypothetical protein